MENEVVYMLAVVALGAGITYFLRALPFLLFAGRDRALPPAVERLGSFISPVIIAGLIVYSYSGLAWQTAWPYLAGVLTVGLQLWRGNPLTSIVAGTALYMLLLGCGGCASQETVTYEQGRVLNQKKPLIRMTNEGIKFQDKPVLPEQVVPRLEALGVSKEAEVYIQLDDDFNDQRAVWVFMHNYLQRAGYKHAIPMRAQRTSVGTAEELTTTLKSDKVPFEGRTFQPGVQRPSPQRRRFQ